MIPPRVRLVALDGKQIETALRHGYLMSPRRCAWVTASSRV
jgi:hypothetical protein